MSRSSSKRLSFAAPRPGGQAARRPGGLAGTARGARFGLICLFIDFVLDHYIKDRRRRARRDKLAPLLKPRYKSAISDAVADLGDAEQISDLSVGFQRYLYGPSERLTAG